MGTVNILELLRLRSPHESLKIDKSDLLIIEVPFRLSTTQTGMTMNGVSENRFGFQGKQRSENVGRGT
jgi:hypothetical protein